MTDTDIVEELAEQINAYAKVHDVSPEELTVAPEDEVEELGDLREENEDLEDEVEELEDEIEEKESEIEEMQDEVDEVAEAYAESLAPHTPAFDEEDLTEKFSVGELREKHDALVEDDETEADELASAPDAQSVDNDGDNTQSAGGDDGGTTESTTPDEVEDLAAQMEGSGSDVWAEAAEELREDYAE